MKTVNEVVFFVLPLIYTPISDVLCWL